MPRCPACETSCGDPFFSLPTAPVVCNVLCDDETAARAVPRAPIDLVVCPNCGLVFNASFDEKLVEYSGVYENALHFSPTFREHEDWAIDTLVGTQGVRDGVVAEIGCGDGHFLSGVCERGGNTGVGFDPAFDHERHAADLHERVRIEDRHFDAAALGDVALKAVACRHVLEHIASPVSFLRALREQLSDPATTVFFEVPSAMHSLERRGFWDILYEHCNYFSPIAIRHAFELAGFEVGFCEERYHGQFLCVIASPGKPANAMDAAGVARVVEHAEAFGQQFQSELRDWRNRLNSIDGRVVVWGAGTKGVMFLNALGDAADRVSHVIDINPRKRGKRVVGVAHEIVEPDRLAAIDPAAVLVMNGAYAAEITEQIRALGVEAPVLVVS